MIDHLCGSSRVAIEVWPFSIVCLVQNHHMWQPKAGIVNVRHRPNRDFGFTDVDRVENIRRVCEVSKLVLEAGLITPVSFSSRFASERMTMRSMLEEGEFIEIYGDAPLE